MDCWLAKITSAFLGLQDATLSLIRLMIPPEMTAA
jgi:hypothetical protein